LDPVALNRLAISDSGFVFDPGTGHSFTVNETGLLLLQRLKDAPNTAALVDRLAEEYSAARRDIERDVDEFIAALRSQLS
jgi:PqqD family protein of HPr-rel-A system